MTEQFQRQLIAARRQQILHAATTLIAEQGFQRTTIKQIAARAEVADGTIYNYFKNKDAILMAIIGQITEAENRDLHFAAARQQEFASFTKEYLQHRLAEVAEGYDLLKVLLTETLANPELGKQVYEQIYAPSFATAEDYFGELAAANKLPSLDPAMLARLFAAPLMGLLLLRLLGDDHVREHWTAYGEELGNGILAQLYAQPADPSAKPRAVKGQGKKKKKKKGKKHER